MAPNESQEINLDQDVQIIREILFGKHLKSLDGKIVSLEKDLAALKQENLDLKSALDNEEKARKKAEKDLDGNLANLRVQLKDNQQQFEKELEKAISATSKTHRDALSDLSTTIDTRLEKMQASDEDHRQKLENLVATLAAALQTYNKD